MQAEQGVVYKEITVEQAEALFDAGVLFQYRAYENSPWRDWCPEAMVGNREAYYSPLDKLADWNKLRLRVIVE